MTIPRNDALDEVYRLRARRLAARRPVRLELNRVPALVFGVGDEQYAVELSALAEVFAYRGCTPVPGAPGALLGVVNVRGNIEAVAELGRILDLPTAAHHDGGYVLMLRHHGRTVGFRVDSIDQVRELDPANLKSLDDGASSAGARCIRGWTLDGIKWLDAQAAVSSLA